MTNFRMLPGFPYPLGATWDGTGINFALFSANATKVELLLFDSPHDVKPSAVVIVPERTSFVWHCYLKGLHPPLYYGYRVHGPYAPEQGHRFNHHKLLLDPYARAISGSYRWSPVILGYREGDGNEDLSFDTRDSCGDSPKSMVLNTSFDWGDDHPPAHPWCETIIYETHVKGISIRHPKVPEHLRGTFLGLASPPIIEHLTSLGVTAVQLLPIHQHIIDRSLASRGLTNYWGYNTIGYFAPDCRYASSREPGAAVAEFKHMVRELHKAGIEVILDVVYNHTGEGDHLGPTVCFRGIDNASYYRLHPDNPRFYLDFTGCGNSLNIANPFVLQLIMDSLRYWVQEMHVDGFRLDLATTLGREGYEFDRLSAFFDTVHQDPVLARVKMIAEPWDLGPGGFQPGAFPAPLAELNAHFRDTVRRFWCGNDHQRADLAYRLSGSSDLFEHSGRSPLSSVNFVTAHDGFTLEDLVSYERKHNEANGEENRDGADDNASCNHGVEGPTDDPVVLASRKRHKANLLATLMLSQGVPLFLGGDEIGRSQGGNNNAYCQDNELSWYDWNLSSDQQQWLAWVASLIRLRHGLPTLRRRHFFRGAYGRDGLKDVAWVGPDGKELTVADWSAPATVLGLLLSGMPPGETLPDGTAVHGAPLMLLVNSGPDPVEFRSPPGVAFRTVLLDTARGILNHHGAPLANAHKYVLDSQALALLKVCVVETKEEKHS